YEFLRPKTVWHDPVGQAAERNLPFESGPFKVADKKESRSFGQQEILRDKEQRATRVPPFVMETASMGRIECRNLESRAGQPRIDATFGAMAMQDIGFERRSET